MLSRTSILLAAVLILTSVGVPATAASVSSISDVEGLALDGWDGQNVLDLTESLCEISARHPSYRMSGSDGANEAADFIMERFD